MPRTMSIRRRLARAATTAVPLAALLAASQPSPAAADATDLGGGAIAGTVGFVPANPLSVPGCDNGGLSIAATGSVAVSWGGASFAGTVSLSGGPSSSFFVCTGSMEATLTGTPGAGSLQCGATGPLPTLTLLEGDVLLLAMHGQCRIGSVTTPVLDIDIAGTLVPTGVDSSLRTSSAEYAAGVSFQPSS